MSTSSLSAGLTATATGTTEVGRRSPQGPAHRRRAGSRGHGVSAVMAVVTALVLSPLLVVGWLSLRPRIGSEATAPTLETYGYVLSQTSVLTWLSNSLVTAGLATAATLLVAAPAGYVISRGRGRAVGGFALMIFVVQSLPVVVFVIPLFVLFAQVRLVDSLLGVMIVYVAGSLTVATWMMAAYFDTIPVALEEAAWMDGCSVIKGFVQVVLRNSLPGVLSTAIYSFLLAWNDYLIALVFLRSESRFTLPIGLQTFFQQNGTDWGPVMAVAVIMMAPPVIVFAVLHRHFSIGGIGGSLAGR